jgi:hypothetical protein
MLENNKHILHWKGTGFGEPLVMSMVARIIRDNGIPNVFFKESRKTAGLLEDTVPTTFSEDNCIWHRFVYSIDNPKPILQQYLDYYSKVFNKKLEQTINYVPVKYHDIPEIPSYDVVIHSRTGDFTPYKQWCYFPTLKKMLEKSGIRFIDLAEHPIFGIEYLNWANKAKLYVGLDTGPSHYVSQFVQGRCLILQGGFVTYEYWASPYNYEHIQVEDIPCRPCFLSWNKIAEGNRCKLCNKCMMEIDPLVVFDKVREMLK